LKTAVVILNFNGKAFLELFLPSVITHSKNAEVFVADNASTDDSLDFLKNSFPEVNVIRLPKNYGFAGGYNEALKQIDATYFVLLNSDVEVTENWLESVIEKLDNDPSIAAAQPKILDYKNKNDFEYAGASGGFLDFLLYPFCRGRIFYSCEEDTGQYDQEMEIFWATGACLFIRADIYKSFGGFDARFFAHMEEVDLCWRIKNEGHKVYCFPQSVVYHVGGGTLQKSNPYKTFLNYRNNLAMIFKNVPGRVLFPIIFFRLILDGISSLRYLKEGTVKDIWAVIKAHFAFYAMIPYLMKNRSVRFLAYEELFPKSIIWLYFYKKIRKFSELIP
jgi:GT2 family glycosyltransferase